ncbi:restriction endonuclease subunit S [Nocardia sp. MH4]|uniref:restriction endonuclease subunit S n=1 Tax=Nocardia sp. MH4 TaxID=1768677 RepID=UPI001C4F1C0F|nr:restriction endonuclease subunit S [Nocardia sp. MH4]
MTSQVHDLVRVAPGETYPLLGVKWYAEGPFLREVVTSETSKATRFFRVQPGQFIYNRLFAWKGSFGLVSDELAGSYVSNEFPLFDCDRSRLLPQFLNLYFGQPSLWSYVERVSTGTTASRSRWKEAQFNELKLALPSVAEQRRIVDIMAVVDAQIETVAEEMARSRALLSRLNSDVVGGLPDSRVLGDITATRSGPSYAAADVHPTPCPGSVPMIGIPNTKPDGSLDLTDIGHVVGLPESVGKIDESSLVLIRTNGNRQRIGNVYLPPAGAHGHVVSAFQFLMKVKNPADREFVYWLLREPSMQRSMSEAASGTTGLGNLAVRWLNAVHIPWSEDPAERARVVAPLRSMQYSIDASNEELAQLRAFRSALLASLLEQEVEIPESYDRLFEGVS